MHQPKRQTHLRLARQVPAQDLYVGQVAAQAEWSAWWAQPHLQHLNVNGPPGVGKTRFVRHVTRQIDEVIWIDASAILSAQDLCLELALRLKLSWGNNVQLDGMLLQLTAAFKAMGDVLLILDHVDACHETALDVLTHLHHHLDTLRTVSVGYAPLPIGPHNLILDPLSVEEGVALFEDRASMVKPDFAAAQGGLTSLVELIEQLDGLPLAIELAAAHVRLMPPAALLKRLHQRRFQLLRPSRLRGATLSASLIETLAAAWAHLPELEQRVLRRCVVFCGDFSLDAAESIIPNEGEEDLWIWEVIESLCARSMIQVLDSVHFPGEVRLRLLGALKHFILEHHPPEHAQTLHQRHAAFFTQVGAQWADAARRDTSEPWIYRLAQDRHHFECIIHRQVQPVDAVLLLDELTQTIGPTQDHIELLSSALAATEDPTQRARLQRALGANLHQLGQLEDALAHYQDAVAIQTPIHDHALIEMAEVHRALGQHDVAIESLQNLLEHKDLAPDWRNLARIYLAAHAVDKKQTDEAREILAKQSAMFSFEDMRLACTAWMRLAYVHFYLNAPEQQRHAYKHLLDLATRLADNHWIARATQGLGEVACVMGDYEASVRILNEQLPHLQRMGLYMAQSRAWGILGAAYHRMNAFDDAARAYEEAIFMMRAHNSTLYLGTYLHAQAVLAHERERWTLAEHHYQLAIDHYQLVAPNQDNLGASLLCLSWLFLELMDTQAAKHHAQLALDCFDPNSTWALACRLTALHCGAADDLVLGLVEASLAEQDGSATSLFILRALQSMHIRQIPPPTSSLSTHSLYGRLVTRLSQSPTPPAPVVSTGPALRLGPEAKWFELDGQARVNLSRRKAIRLILNALANQTTPLDVYDLFDLGWPGQSIAPELAAERVYWAVRSLRQLGLQDILLTTDDGYLLHPDVTIQWAEV